MLLQGTFKANEQFVIENDSQLIYGSKPLIDKLVEYLTIALSNIYLESGQFGCKRRNNAVDWRAT